MRPLTIFISHSSGLFTDHVAHGDGLVAYSIITLLAARGHRLHVAAQKVDLKYPLPPNVILHPIVPKIRNPFLERVEYAVRSRLLLRRLLRTEKIDLIHQLNPVFAGLSLGLIGFSQPLVLGAYAARWPNDPDGMVSSGGLLSRILGGVRDTIASLQQRQAAAIILSTPAAASQIPRMQALGDRVHVLPFGIDPAFFVPAPDWDSPRHVADEEVRPVIFFLASVNRRKGIFYLLEAFQSVAARFPMAVLRIVGAGDELSEAKRVAAASPAAAQIEFLPPHTRKDTVALYQQCSIFCVPSLGEPFGMSAIEAMSCARPVVVTAAGGPLHTVQPEGGIHVPMADSEALAAALIRLLGDPEERLRMGRFNRAYAQAELSWSVIIPRLEEIYARVLGL